MHIRPATIQDATSIAALLFLAMENFVFEYVGEKKSDKALAFLKHFVEKENNQYSYKHCFVAELNNEIVGAICVYDGAKLIELAAPLIAYAREHANPEFTPEAETEAGEMYIDSFGVDKHFQGQGIGSKMLKYLIELIVVKDQQNLGLLVEESNPKAERLYLKLGFTQVGNKVLSGKKLKHLQIKSK